MTLGTDFCGYVQTLIGNPALRTCFTLTPITLSTSNFAYDASTETAGSARTIYAVPANYIKNRTGFQKFGELEEGEIRFLIQSCEAIDTDDKATFQSTDYFIRSIDPVYFNDSCIAQTIILSKRQTTS